MKSLTRFTIAILSGALVLATSVLPIGLASGSASTPGVTNNTITIGVTYVDLSSVAQFIHGLNQGNFQAAYQALIKNINAHGGIDGRKIVAYYEPINPVGTTSPSTACAQLTEDHDVFAVMGFFQGTDPACYVTLHHTALLGGSMTPQLLAAAKAPWFSTSPIENQLESATVATAAAHGIFKGKKVAVFSQSDAPPGLVSSVIAALKKHGVTPVATAQVNAETNDAEAVIQQIAGVVTQKFQSAGANVVVAVGNAGQSWPNATNSGTYHPELVAGSYSALSSYTSAAKADAPAIAGAITAATTGPPSTNPSNPWNGDSQMSQCAKIVKAAGQPVPSPVNNTSAPHQQYVAVVKACQDLALFTAIARHAGRTLNYQTFARAGATLGTVRLPGVGSGSFTKSAPAGHFPLYLYTWNAGQGKFVVNPKPIGTT